MKEKKGTIYVVLAAILYSLGGLGIKVIPWSGMAINGARAMIALVVIGGYLLVTKHRIYLDKWVVLGALCICGTNMLFCIANKLTTAANAIVLQFTAPVFVILLGLFFWKKRPTKLEVTTCVAVFIGVLFSFWESLGGGGIAGDVLAIVAGLSYAGVFFLNHILGKDSVLAVFWGCVISALVGIPFLLGETDFSLVPMISITVLGLFQMGLAFLFLVLGLQTTPPVTASLVSGLEPVLNPILVAVFYHETMGIFAIIGGAIVVGSVVVYNVICSRTAGKLSSLSS